MSSVPQRQGDYAQTQQQASTSRQPSQRSSHTATAPSVTRKHTGSTSAGREREDAKMIGQWRIGRTIGKGSSGRVKIAKHAITGKYAAIKIVPKGLILSSRLSVSEAGARADKVMLGIEREIVIMKLIDHPNVLNLYDVWETSSELYLIMEYVPGGELFDYLVKRGRLPVSEALHYFQQIIHAVDYCHRFNICHRDLKPENLLLDKDKNIKVADFGMAAWEAGERMLETSCGSPHYASPEIVAGKAYHGSSSDIWSCGIILFALLTGRLPFDDDNIRSLLQKVKVGVFEMPDEIKDPARDLLKRMLEKDPERRITIPDILRHPFFVSRSPRPIPGRQLVSPPSLGEVERPVNSPEEIDADIMGNLKTLWHGVNDDEIVAALMSKDKTWEKAIYHLLIKYRNKHLENYNMEEEDDEAIRRGQARKQAGAPSPAKRKGGPQPAARPRLTPLGENENIQERIASPVDRPAAPTPKKASGGMVEQSPAADRGGKLAIPRGPRPPLSPRPSSYGSDSIPYTPAIVLQEATPTKDLPYPSVNGSRPTSMAGPASPMLPPPSPALSDITVSPIGLNVPQVQDERLQHFFNEVANQLNTMNIRSSVTSGSSRDSAILGSDYQAYLAYASGSPTVRPLSIATNNTLPLNTTSVDPNQFADADDDETIDTASIASYSYASPTPTPQPGHQSPLVGLGIGGPPPASHGGRPGLYPTQTANPQRWSYASSTVSSSTTTQYRGPSNGSSSYSAVEPSTPQISAPHISWSPAPPIEATRPAPPAPTRVAPPRPTSVVKSAIEREGSYVVIDGSDLPASDPSLTSWSSKQSGFSAHRGQDGFGMLKKKKKVISIDPVPWTPGSSGPATTSSISSSNYAASTSGSGSGSASGASPSPKRSWFNNLFSFKPPTCTLLCHDSIANTREKTKRILDGLGVRVAVVEIDGLRGLNCRLDDVRDAQGGNTILKGVRFRVEFSRSSGSQTTSTSDGYNTLVSLVQEKGAQSSFKSIFNQLKAGVEAETLPPRPHTAQVASFTLPSAMRGGGQGGSHLSAPPVRYTTSAPNTPVMATTPRFANQQSPGSVQLPSAIRF